MYRELKHIFKKTASSVSYALGGLNKNSPEVKNSFRILLYHSVGPRDKRDIMRIRISPELFFAQMKYLKERKYRVMALSELVRMLRERLPIPERAIAITFDDGYRDNLSEAAVVLNKFNFPATIFVSLDYREALWPLLSKADLLKLADFNIDIGLHSLSHQRLTAIGEVELRQEIPQAKIMLENAVGKQIALFSYPHGVYNARVITMLKESNFNSACSSSIGKNDFNTPLYELCRTEITGADSLFEFRKKLAGAYDLLQFKRQFLK